MQRFSVKEALPDAVYFATSNMFIHVMTLHFWKNVFPFKKAQLLHLGCIKTYKLYPKFISSYKFV